MYQVDVNFILTKQIKRAQQNLNIMHYPSTAISDLFGIFVASYSVIKLSVFGIV